MSVSRCPTFRRLLPNTLLHFSYSGCITLWLYPEVHPSNIMVLTQNSFPYAMYRECRRSSISFTHSSFGQFWSAAIQLRPKPNVKWSVGTVTETEPKLHLGQFRRQNCNRSRIIIVHQTGSIYLHIYPVGSGGVVVNVPATDSQSFNPLECKGNYSATLNNDVF